MSKTPQESLEKKIRVILTFKKNPKIFEIQIFQDFTCLTPKREAPDLQVFLENFLETLHPSCRYVKHFPGSGLSNARCIVSPRHTQMKRHPIF